MLFGWQAAIDCIGCPSALHVPTDVCPEQHARMCIGTCVLCASGGSKWEMRESEELALLIGGKRGDLGGPTLKCLDT